MLRFFVIAASAAAFGALPASANASIPFGMPGAQPEPAGPISRMLDFASSTSLCLVW
jgi:hypothetical protein